MNWSEDLLGCAKVQEIIRPQIVLVFPHECQTSVMLVSWWGLDM